MSTVPAGPVVVVLEQGSPSPAKIVRAAPGGVVFALARGAVRPSTAALAASLAPIVHVDPTELHAAGRELSAYRPAGITTFSERALPLTAELAAAVGRSYHTPDTVLALTHKDRQRACLAAAGVDRTRSRVVTNRTAVDAALTTGEPFVVKPLRGEGSLDTYLARTCADVPTDLAVSPSRPFLVEEYLAGRDEHPFGDYVSVETLSVEGHVHVLGVTGKLAQLPPFREPGQFVPSRLDPAEELSVRDLAVRAVAAVGLTRGLAHTEVKLTPDGPRIIEVNGRLGGHIDELYGRALALDLLALELTLAGGTAPPLHPKPADLVHYQHSNLSPVGGGTLFGVSGTAAVRKLPGVSAYRGLVARGAALAGGARTAELDLLTGDAEDHDAVLLQIDAALAELTFMIQDGSGTRVWQASRGGLQCVD